MKTKYWVALFALLAALCAGTGLLLTRNSQAATAGIYQDGVLIRTVPLSKDARIVILAPNGGRNTIVVQDGQICVRQATCPDKLCVKQGWSDSQSKPIVCLPNGLVIRPEGSEASLDAIAN